MTWVISGLGNYLYIIYVFLVSMSYGYGCMGMSRYCEWDASDTTYSKYGVTGACTSRCTSYCNNYGYYNASEGLGKPNRPGYKETNAAYPNGCFKCYGMFPGFLDPDDPYKIDPYGNGMYESGPCSADGSA